MANKLKVQRLVKKLEEDHSELGWWEAYCYGFGGIADTMICPTASIQKKLGIPASSLLLPDDLGRFLISEKNARSRSNKTRRRNRYRFRPAPIPEALRRALLISNVSGAEGNGYARLWASPHQIEHYLIPQFIEQINHDHECAHIWEHRLHPIGIRSRSDISAVVSRLCKKAKA